MCCSRPTMSKYFLLVYVNNTNAWHNVYNIKSSDKVTTLLKIWKTTCLWGAGGIFITRFGKRFIEPNYRPNDSFHWNESSLIWSCPLECLWYACLWNNEKQTMLQRAGNIIIILGDFIEQITEKWIISCDILSRCVLPKSDYNRTWLYLMAWHLLHDISLAMKAGHA